MNSLNELVDPVRNILLEVASGRDLKEVNDKYKKLYQELHDKLSSEGIENPNPFSDLWEFYQYWKDSNLKTYASRRAYVFSIYKNLVKKPTELKSNHHQYVNQERIGALKTITDFDTSKLIKMCEELNTTYKMGCYLAAAMLVRAILDHVPPMFGAKNFAEVANNYKGTKSFKEAMTNLDSSLRKIADAHLHTPIRKKEALPTNTQVDFSNALDVLLAEINVVCK